MAINLIESIRDLFDNDFVSKASSSLGESQSGIQKAIGGIIPAVLGGVLAKVNSGDAGGIFNMVRNAAGSGGVSGLLKGDINSLMTKGMSLLSGLFGSRTSAVSNAISNYAGIRESSANTLLGLSAPPVLAKLGEEVYENDMDVPGFASYVIDQRESILNALPSGLNLGSILGLGSLASVGGRVTSLASTTRERATAGVEYATATRERKEGSWGWPLALLLLAGLAVWYFVGRGRDKTQVAATTTLQNTSSEAAKRPAGPDIAPNTTRMSTRVRLVNGVELNAYAGGVEERLVSCLNDALCKAGKEKWFDFDNINFETGSAHLTPESHAQVQNIVAVLNAYPNAKIKIGGYTDRTGNVDANMVLSQQRADAVLGAIKDAGARPEQLVGAEGYGSSMAKIPADASDAERRVDRRISVQLRAK